MTIDVMVAAEFLFQAGYSEAQRELASTFVHRRMLAVETSPLRDRPRTAITHAEVVGRIASAIIDCVAVVLG